MKRISIVALVAGAMVLGLAGCGSDKSDSADGMRPISTTTGAAKPTNAAVATSAGAPIEPPSGAPTKTAAAKKTVAPNGAQTTCGDFRDLDDATEKTVIDQILAANPNSILEGSPNVALGTAKLACLAPTYANTQVAVAIRVASK
ncbi:hypothetical protein AB0N05_17740 [Nocardia sp. NPDC051030]|uniref:hypothetical protein n=1 Tax=Nocardia sp. NPDC051030 TaxID=3155162 RepID=UPI00343F70A4